MSDKVTLMCCSILDAVSLAQLQGLTLWSDEPPEGAASLECGARQAHFLVQLGCCEPRAVESSLDDVGR